MKTSRLLALILALAMLLSCAAFAEESAEAADDPLLATVNGSEVHLSDVYTLYSYLISYYSDEGYDMTDEENLSVVRAWSMEDAIQTRLIAQYAAENGLDSFTEEEEQALVDQADEQWASMIESYIDYFANEPDNISEEERAQLEENAALYYASIGFPYEYNLRLNREEVLQERVQAELCSGVTVTDEEIRAEYEARVSGSLDYGGEAMYYELYTYYFGYDLYVLPEGYRAVKQILLPADEELMAEYTRLSALWEEQALASAEESAEVPEDAVTWDQVEEARKAVLAASQDTVDAIKADLEAGTPFEDLMALYGTDEFMLEEPFATRGIYVHQDSIMWSPTLIEAAFSVDSIGDVSEPALDSEGIHIVKYLGDVPGGPVELDDSLRASLYESLLISKENEAFQSAMEQMIAEAEIVYTEAGESWRMDQLDEYTEEEGSQE